MGIMGGGQATKVVLCGGIHAYCKGGAGVKVKNEAWRMQMRCDECGRFFSSDDLDKPGTKAHHTMVTPDSAYTSETYWTVCDRCGKVKDLTDEG